MEDVFVIDSSVGDSHSLNKRIEDKIESRKAIVDSLSHSGGVRGFADYPYRSWSIEDFAAMDVEMHHIQEGLSQMNSTWDIRNYKVYSNNLIKRIIWKLMRIVFKPLISSISLFNSVTYSTVASMASLQKTIIETEKARGKK